MFENFININVDDIFIKTANFNGSFIFVIIGLLGVHYLYKMKIKKQD